jgi:hypothetical protein
MGTPLVEGAAIRVIVVPAHRHVDVTVRQRDAKGKTDVDMRFGAQRGGGEGGGASRHQEKDPEETGNCLQG